MQIFTGVSDVDGSEWCEEDVINLQRRLTDEEFEDNKFEFDAPIDEKTDAQGLSEDNQTTFLVRLNEMVDKAKKKGGVVDRDFVNHSLSGLVYTSAMQLELFDRFEKENITALDKDWKIHGQKRLLCSF